MSTEVPGRDELSKYVQITAARLHRVRMPLVHEFRTSSHRKTFLDHILVELEDASGAAGWGEIASSSARATTVIVRSVQVHAAAGACTMGR